MTVATKTATLKQLAPGDRVLHVGDGPAKPLTVTRVRPTQILCVVHRFDREDFQDLDQPGRIVPATTENVEAAKEEVRHDKPRARWKPKADHALELARQIVAMPPEELAKLGEKRLRQIVAGWTDAY